MSTSPTIVLTHCERGAMKVRIAEEATWWLKERHWTDDDSDGATYPEGDFEETREQIDALLADASDPLEGISIYTDEREPTFSEVLLRKPW